MPEQLEFSNERGVQNPNVVDLVSLDQDTGDVVLSMIEARPWGSSPEQLDQLQEKLNNYLDYALDGFLSDQYPQYRNRPVRIRLECPILPEGPPLQLISAMERYLQSIDFKLEIVHPS